MKYEYYYNNVPGKGLCRNNLIYTSLISDDKKVFCQWYFNDGEYHKGQNEVMDPALMELKWDREIKYLTTMSENFPNLVPEILDIDYVNKKVFLKIDGADFWEMSKCSEDNYNLVLPDWQDQMTEIIQAHHSLDLYKYSMHPSSYFVVDGRLKSINYFFTYHKSEGPISIADHSSHIYSTRQAEMRKHIESMGISWNDPQELSLLEHLCWESFRTNFPDTFIKRAKSCIR
jgi:hypothetical protein